MDSLFVMAYHGNLLEYHLEPHAAAGIPQDKVTEESPIELEVIIMFESYVSICL